MIGSDSPTLAPTAIERAFGCLATENPAVLMPSTDGGFVLLGLRRPVEGLFEDVPWGGSEVTGRWSIGSHRRASGSP